MVACSIAPTPLPLITEALHSFDILQPLSGCC
ncbi:BgTH12-05672 [Blumeria graminis f. sp. triticale]|uniref:BgTH12-05672 n=1 Tax=Blumeria graminis f. sp. triticale TaxID=1689686 RepID=A0A9W4D4H0_BLUGR|nr:BgTH12-05672 [Blumeria graminis f. sp. triticale]